jgi:hypothetical protein
VLHGVCWSVGQGQLLVCLSIFCMLRNLCIEDVTSCVSLYLINLHFKMNYSVRNEDEKV